MKHYIGIDLGTTNSAICSYDGTNVRVWKSPEQNDVTPSAIYVDKRGNKYYGQKAYNQAPYNPTNSATLFKRFMGTNTKIELEAAGLSLTPEECSAEILKVLYGYLPEEVRNDPETAVVITVPAAFNQMKKDATLQAAKLAGINNVALMQEPVAAIMSIMRASKQEGIFLVYDLGGGTFDVSIAENINGKVNLLAHGGVEMCGGRDIDRMVFNQIVIPWLRKTFELPEDFLVNRKYKSFCRIAQWATERAKMELSAMETSTIALSEGEARTVDEAGNEMYVDIDINRGQVDGIISDLVKETVEVSRETLTKAGLSANDLERIVFVGGPTNYKPLRDKVAYELSLPANIDVNPMTAVAEGASIFAESIDWSTANHTRKAANEVVKTDISLSFKYEARTSSDSAKVMCILGETLNGYTIQFTSDDTGWSSGNAVLKNNLLISLPLPKNGGNSFTVKVFNEFGQEQAVGTNKIIITKTLATIGAIPASHSIGVEVLNKLGGVSVLDFLVKEGDSLPQKGTRTFKAGQTLKAGSTESLNFKLWEGNIESPIDDNRCIGVFKIVGTDIDAGVIPTGADIECEYEMSDSGTITLSVSIPCIGMTLTGKNFYSRQEGQDLVDIDSVAEQGRLLIERIDDIAEKVDDPNLADAKKKAERAASLDSQPQCEPEDVQKANNELLEAKKLISKTRQANLKPIRQMELDSCVEFFDKVVRQYARPAEEHSFDNLTRTAQRSIDNDANDFDNVFDSMKTKNTLILLRQDWFVVDWYQRAVANPNNYIDKNRYNELKQQGNIALSNDDIDQLRQILFELLSIQIHTDSGDGNINVVKG
ncbi:MAG: Hsp70 family protein [Candidatus Pararuminococcus gallinarum]|jgi:molecular chaperone DnaK